MVFVGNRKRNFSIEIENKRSPPIIFTVLTLASLLAADAAVAASVIGTHRLYCMSCVVIPGDTTQLDQFRVRQRLLHPACRMEPVECLSHQDTCVTITMQVAPRHFWIGSGCDQRVNYDFPADRDGCAEMQTLTRSYQPGYMEERRAVQRVCLCTGNLCNRSAGRNHISRLLLLLFTCFSVLCSSIHIFFTNR